MVNQVISQHFYKKQQRPWAKRGVHLLVQTRVKTLLHELGAVFHQWYPDLQREAEPRAACPQLLEALVAVHVSHSAVLKSRFDKIGTALSNHHRRDIGIGTHHIGHDGSIGHP